MKHFGERKALKKESMSGARSDTFVLSKVSADKNV
jgi:hypothetical protein